MKKTGVILALIGTGGFAHAQYLHGISTAGTEIRQGISKSEEVQLDELLIKLYGNKEDALNAKGDLYQRLVRKSKINSAVSRESSDCIDIFDPK